MKQAPMLLLSLFVLTGLACSGGKGLQDIRDSRDDGLEEVWDADALGEIPAPLPEARNAEILGDAAKSIGSGSTPQEAVDWLLQQPEVGSATIVMDGKQIAVGFRSGLEGAIVLQSSFLRADLPELLVTDSLELRNLAAAVQPTNQTAVVLTPFSRLMEDGAEVGNALKTALTGLGFSVKGPFDDSSATVARFEETAGAGFVYVLSHGMVASDGETMIATGEKFNPLSPAHRQQAKREDVGIYTFTDCADCGWLSDWADWGIYFTIQARFFESFQYPESFFYIDACDSMSNTSLPDALFASHAAAVAGWATGTTTGFVRAMLPFLEHLLTVNTSVREALDWKFLGSGVTQYSVEEIFPYESKGKKFDFVLKVRGGLDPARVYANYEAPDCEDHDGDGYGNGPDCKGSDCDDQDGTVFQQAPELCDGQDNDCDGTTDEPGADDCILHYEDADGDGWGRGAARCLCAPTVPYLATRDGDCDDNRFKVHPEAAEVCDGLDNDCNGETDEGNVCPATCTDNDKDGFGIGGGCSGPADCDDSRAKVYPNAPELCDGIDNNCDTVIDEGCGEVAFEDPEDTETTDVQVTVTQVEPTGQANLIRLFAKVETQSGEPLEQLTAGNFKLWERVGTSPARQISVDSVVATKKTSEGMSASLLIDSSGSMGDGEGSPLDQARKAAKLFVMKLKPTDAAAVVDFGSNVQVTSDFTNDKVALYGAIDACADGGMTSMYDALLEGIDLSRNRIGQKAMILLSDGADNDSYCSPCSPNVAIVPALEAGLPIFTIGLGATAGSALESDLVAISNGTFAGKNGSGYYRTPTPADLQTIYETISTVLKNIYVVGWYTTGASGEQVEVTIQVSYTGANGSFVDTFAASYMVP